MRHRLSGHWTLAAGVAFALFQACSSGCGGSGNGGGGDLLAFPRGFLFGVATAGFQVEMGCPTLPEGECRDPNSDWYQYVTSPEMVRTPIAHLVGEDPASVGPGEWELFEEDFDRAASELHLNAFRLGIEWSRIFPTSTVGIEGEENLRAAANGAAIEHYHSVFRALRSRGLKPLVTLNHYTLPVWIHDAVGCHFHLEDCSPRGWLERALIVHEIAKYAGFVAREFGAEVDLWTTLNEPMAVLFSGFLLPTQQRTNPPDLPFQSEALKAAFGSMIEAHARMVDAVRENDTFDADGDGLPTQVGIVYAMSPVRPLDPDRSLDRQAAENVFYLWTLAFLNAVLAGELDENLDGNAHFREDLAGRADFVGLNYYVRMAAEGLRFSILPKLSPLATFNPLTIGFDEIYPRGIYEMSEVVQERYHLPVYVTENNGQRVASGDMEAEVRNLVEQLEWLQHATRQGIDVRGYFYWSLIDNYEWNQGMDSRWGLYAVDTGDRQKSRTPRVSVPVLGAIARAGAIPADLAERYPVSLD